VQNLPSREVEYRVVARMLTLSIAELDEPPVGASDAAVHSAWPRAIAP
jgi:hypothetical protein